MTIGLLSDLGKHASVSSLSESLDHLNRRGNAATAMMTITKLEQWLKMALIERFSNKPRRLIDKLFDYKGPLGAFSGKIDMAYAIGAVSQDTYRALHVLRDIRNGFAHADDYMDFDHEEMRSHFLKLDPMEENKELAFLRAAVSCIEDIKTNVESTLLADALRRHAKASPEK